MIPVPSGVRSSECGRLLIDQLELGYEELEASAGEDEALGQRTAIGTNVEAFTRAWPSRKPLPAHRCDLQRRARRQRQVRGRAPRDAP